MKRSYLKRISVLLLAIGLGFSSIAIAGSKPTEIKEDGEVESFHQTNPLLNQSWDPFSEITRWQEYMEQIFSRHLMSALNAAANTAWSPAIDLEEKKEEYLVQIDLPGMEKDQISINVQGNILTVSGERKSEREENDAAGVKRYERSFGVFQRSFSLPENIDPERITAGYDKGVLMLHLPKIKQAEPEPSRNIPIN